MTHTPLGVACPPSGLVRRTPLAAGRLPQMTGHGMTLLELLIVVIVVGVMASLGMATYRRTVERERQRRAQDQLMAIYGGERAFFFSNNTYLAVPAGAPLATWRQIFVDDPDPAAADAVYQVGPGGTGVITTSFVATATRNAGPCNGQTVTINQNRVLAGGWLACAMGL